MHRGLIHHQIVRFSDAKKSALFYAPVLEYFGYELSGSDLVSNYAYQDWKRWDHDTPHEISICDAVASVSDTHSGRRRLGKLKRHRKQEWVTCRRVVASGAVVILLGRLL